MPQNKEQHFVPRFYLKRFSKDKKSICLYNLKSKKKIVNANLKKQCYKDYFYGKELALENTLGSIETEVSKILSLIDSSETLPPPETSEYFYLILYILTQ